MKKYNQPQIHKPTREQELKNMNEIARFIGDDKVLVSNIYPDLQVRGKAKYHTTHTQNNEKRTV